MINDTPHLFIKSLSDGLVIRTKFVHGKNSILAQVYRQDVMIYYQEFELPVLVEDEQESSSYILSCQEMVAQVVERMIDLGQIKI